MASPASLSLTARAVAKGVWPFLSRMVRSMLGWARRISEHRGCLQEMETWREQQPVESLNGGREGGGRSEGVI